MITLALLLALQDAPNVVIIYADDLGWGDLGCYGHPTIRTPNLDRMAAEGQRWTDFYSAAPVCTPSRFALLTGRLPVRAGMSSSKRRVLFPDSKGGIPSGETTLAEALKGRGYATACVGKWHLGRPLEHLPTRQGFDRYFGIPYSNDMDRRPGVKGALTKEPKSEYWNAPLLRDEKELERSPDQTLLTKRYTEEAVAFIRASKAKPFFLYLAHNMPHVPLFASKDFAGRSARGLYGDVVEELDWSVGEVLKTLRDEGLDRKTLVVFSSDNGPWLIFDDHGGSAGLLRDGKGGTFEGGMRVPGIFWMPGKIAPRTVRDIGSTLDLFATVVKLAGGDPGETDGVDLSAALFEGAASPRESMLYYRDDTLFAVRKGRWKGHFRSQPAYGDPKAVEHETPLVYDLGVDPGEKWDVAAKRPDVVAELRALADAHLKTVKPAENQLER
ncbi:MAG TPA: sulfatase [Planctomycetota bacterium]